MNLDKLMKRMKKLDKDQGWGGQLGGGGKSGAEGTGQHEKNGSANKKHKSKKGKGEGAASAPSPAKPHRFEPAKKDKRAVKAAKLAAKQTFTPASSANAISSLVDRAPPVAEVASSPKAPVRASAPNFEEEAVAGTSTGQPKQTALQTSLRAKLAGGKFRMLNETLYTSTGEQAWETMKEEGAFDDVRTRLRLFASCSKLTTPLRRAVSRRVPLASRRLASSPSCPHLCLPHLHPLPQLPHCRLRLWRRGSGAQARCG